MVVLKNTQVGLSVSVRLVWYGLSLVSLCSYVISLCYSIVVFGRRSLKIYVLRPYSFVFFCFFVVRLDSSTKLMLWC